MIYVLSASRRHTLDWARGQGLKPIDVRHVQGVGSLPGVLNMAKNRVVKLESYSTRRDHWAIDAKLKSLMRRGGEIEEFVGGQPPELDLETLSPLTEEPGAEEDFGQDVDMFDEGDSLPSGENQVTNDTGEPEVVDLAANLRASIDAERARRLEGVRQVEGDDDHPAGQMQVGGAIPLTSGQAPLPDPEAQAAINADHDANSVGEPIEDEKPAPKRRARRNNQQIAYDNAFAEYEEDPSEINERLLGDARKALEKRDANDPRLTEGTEDLDF